MEEAKNTIEQERFELNTLINKGVSFEVQDVEVQHKKYLWGLIRKKTLKPVIRKFEIKEPTLSTLDRISSESIEIVIDENKLKGEDVITQAKQIAGKHAMRCAKIIAIAVLGTDYLIPKRGKGDTVKYVEDTRRLDELTLLFARTIKPSELYQLCILINTMSNLGDFLNSIRLISADRTTMPSRIEENKED